MREWRKLYKRLSGSAKAAEASDQALLLWHLLLPWQDDEGKIPWDKAMAKQVTACRDWTWGLLQQGANELQRVGMVEHRGGFLCLRRGAELNGNPYGWRETKLYPEDELLQRVATRCQRVAPREEKIREEETRGEESAPSMSPVKKKRGREVTEEIIVQLVERYGPSLGGADGVREAVAEALNHRAADKRHDKALYLHSWMRNQIKFNGSHSGPPRRPKEVDFGLDKYKRQALRDGQAREGHL